MSGGASMIPWNNIAGAAQGVVATGIGIHAGNKAASAERAAANNALSRLGQTKADALSYQQPFYETGQEALSPLTSLLLGKSYDPSTGKFITLNEGDRMNSFLQSPGYQFRLSEGLRAVQASQAARGGLLSGGAMKELTTFGQGQASDEYGNYINQLFGLSGIGQQAANNMSNITTGIGSAMANMAYSGGMANANKYANLSNAAFSVAGQGFAAASGKEGGSIQSSSGGYNPSSSFTAGSYNPSYGQQFGGNMLNSYTSLSGGK